MATASKLTARTGRRWSASVTAHSNALDLDRGVFTWKDPHRIAHHSSDPPSEVIAARAHLTARRCRC
jgi:hypothetical protein